MEECTDKEIVTKIDFSPESNLTIIEATPTSQIITPSSKISSMSSKIFNYFDQISQLAANAHKKRL